MLPWLRSAPSKKEKFFLELLSFVTIIHIVVLFFALLYSSTKEHQHITLHTPITDATAIVFVPLQKHIVKNIPVQKNSSDESSQAPKKMISYDEYEKHLASKKQAKPEKKKKNAQQKKAEQKVVEEKKVETAPVVKKEVEQKKELSAPAKKEKPATFLVTKKTAKKKKAAAQKKDAKKESKQKSAAPKNVDVKEDIKKNKSEKKVDQKQKEVEKKIEEQKKPEDVVQEKIANLEPAQKDEPVVEKPDTPIEQSVLHETIDQTQSEPETFDIDLSNVLFVGTQDLDTLQIQQAITQSILQYWKPPVGLSKNKTCQVTITLSAQGKIEHSVVSKSSGVPSFDMCARGAAVKAVYPKEVWNKKITITLG
jgi:outer membrane biosynthesis protein TonB